MLYKNIDATVLGFLGRSLSLEMSAIQQYLSASRLLKLRGFEEMAQKFQHEAQEEMEHADRIIGKMLMMGVAPNGTQLRPAALGNSLPELISSLQSLENELVDFYQQAVNHCIKINDYDSRIFFEKLLQEEKQHASEMSAWQQEISRIQH